MERSLSDRLKEVAIADHLYMCLAAKGAALRSFGAIVVMPGVGETARIVGAMRAARDTRCGLLICTGTNEEERARGDAYDEERLFGMNIESGFREAYLPRYKFRIAAETVGNHSRMQAENAIRIMEAEKPRGPIAHVAGPWHGPRSYLTFLQACLETYGTIERMPTIFPLIVEVPLASAPDAASETHLAAGYRVSLPVAIAAEIGRRIRYEDAGHVMPLETFESYFRRLAENV